MTDQDIPGMSLCHSGVEKESTVRGAPLPLRQIIEMPLYLGGFLSGNTTPSGSLELGRGQHRKMKMLTALMLTCSAETASLQGEGPIP